MFDRLKKVMNNQNKLEKLISIYGDNIVKELKEKNIDIEYNVDKGVARFLSKDLEFKISKDGFYAYTFNKSFNRYSVTKYQIEELEMIRNIVLKYFNKL